MLSSIKSGKVFYGILWVLGEYIEDNDGITMVVQEVQKVIGELPIGASKQRALEETNGGKDEKEKNTEGAAGSSDFHMLRIGYFQIWAFSSGLNIMLTEVFVSHLIEFRSCGFVRASLNHLPHCEGDLRQTRPNKRLRENFREHSEDSLLLY
jgi:hypothetical protein